MRCPKCKATLVKGELKEYETLVEHVSNPNQGKFPLRDTHTCPNKCFGNEQFFGYEGASYGGTDYEERYYSALDSIDREIHISTHLDMSYGKYRHSVACLEQIRIKGERDIPPRWTLRFYWIKGRLTRIYYRYLYPIKKEIIKWRHLNGKNVNKEGKQLSK